jgi:hypothetical protein
MRHQPQKDKPRTHARIGPARIVSRCRSGALLCKSYASGRTVFTLDGDRVASRHALKAINSGKLLPMRDGLFPGESQSWAAC